MIYTLEEIARRVRPIAEKYQLPAVYVFGSYARGDATEESDVDLLVDTRGSANTNWYYGSLFEDMKKAVDKEIDMVDIASMQSYPNILQNHFFLREVQNEKIGVYHA